jgi:hypothetical protein
MANAPQKRGDKVRCGWSSRLRYLCADSQQVTFSAYNSGKGGGRTYLDEAGVTSIPTRAVDFDTSLAAKAVARLGHGPPCP